MYGAPSVYLRLQYFFLHLHSLVINSHYLLNLIVISSLIATKKVPQMYTTLGAAAFVYLLVERDGALSAAL